jgi:abortive infection bacteriophage resistance protein
LGRGLLVRDEDNPKYYIENIGYYRLSGYMYPFQLPDGSHRFQEGTTFRHILDHYIFDKKLKLALLDALERIEISLRSSISNTYSLTHGPHWYLDRSLFNSPELHAKFLAETKDRCISSNEHFIKAYRNKYTRPEMPPSWMAFETLTFGTLASVYENLKDDENKKAIATKFGTLPSILESWLKSMNFIRNCCAHHSRLWNRRIPLKPKIPTRRQNRFLTLVDEETDKRLYGILTCMVYVLEKINPTTQFKQRFKGLLLEYPQVNVAHMGFHDQWLSEDIWIR